MDKGDSGFVGLTTQASDGPVSPCPSWRVLPVNRSERCRFKAVPFGAVPLQFEELSESTHWVMNPMSVAKLDLLGEICRAGRDDTVLDRACGKGAWPTVLAEHLGADGVDADIHAPFLEEAPRRPADRGVAGRLVPPRVPCRARRWLG